MIPGHHFHGLDGKFSRGGFRREHHRIRPVIDRGGDVRGFGPGRRRGRDHRIEHLGRYHYGLHREAAGADQLLLAPRNVLLRDLHAEVAARHHHGVREADDVVDALQGLGLLHLGHDAGPVADQPARLDHVGGLLHEGERDPVDAELQPEGEVGPVLGGERRDVQQGAGEVDALAVREGAADHHLGDDAVAGEAGHTHPHATVVDEQVLPRRDGGEDLRVRKGDGVAPAFGAIEDEAEALTRDHVEAAAGECSEADLGALEILQNADGPAHLVLERADRGMDHRVVGLRAVAEIEAEGVDARQEQPGAASRATRWRGRRWRRSWRDGSGA